jgi:hypothetical protein
MIRTIPFKRITEDSLIIVPCVLDYDSISLAIDTGASHTTIDITQMLIAGYEISDAISIEKLETASGIIDAYAFIVKQFSSFGIVKSNFKLYAYDFFAYHYLTDFDGVIGLDFFVGMKFCIDMAKSELSIDTSGI